jgi:hypothetical protein
MVELLEVKFELKDNNLELHGLNKSIVSIVGLVIKCKNKLASIIKVDKLNMI